MMTRKVIQSQMQRLRPLPERNEENFETNRLCAKLRDSELRMIGCAGVELQMRRVMYGMVKGKGRLG